MGMQNSLNIADIRLTLTTVDGRTGVELLASGEPMKWDRDGDDETASALFESLTAEGKVEESHKIEGEDWRTMEDTGRGTDGLLEMNQRGWALDACVSACVWNQDPDGYDEEYESTIDAFQRQIDRLEAELTALKASKPLAFSLEERAAVVAGLECLVQVRSQCAGDLTDDLQDLLTNNGGVEPLEDDEIEALGERIASSAA